MSHITVSRFFMFNCSIDSIQGSSGGITYNINNGVQIVGAPPSYSQATANNAGERENHASADLPPPYRAEEEAQVNERLANFFP